MQMQLNDEKPYLEYHAGRPVRKVSPRTKHALVQGALLVILRRCAGSAYRVGTEWQCDLSEALGTKTLLVPDVAAIATSRLMDLSDVRRDSPPFAPDLVVEVRSPNDRADDREWKLRAYLDAGAALVLDVLPGQSTIHAHTKERSVTFRTGDAFRHEAAPRLQFDLVEAFADLL
ncbi:MAG TPA: Uma2 family endonuclease [Candidatus Cybelea sp.]|jgi:Uma2 family endonuclease